MYWKDIEIYYYTHTKQLCQRREIWHGLQREVSRTTYKKNEHILPFKQRYFLKNYLGLNVLKVRVNAFIIFTKGFYLK